jgi:ankyrin repeat protein
MATRLKFGVLLSLFSFGAAMLLSRVLWPSPSEASPIPAPTIIQPPPVAIEAKTPKKPKLEKSKSRKPPLSKAQKLQQEKDDELCYACSIGDLPEIKKWLRRGANINGMSKGGNRPLCNAVRISGFIGRDSNADTVEFLLAHGADPNGKSKSIDDETGLVIDRESPLEIALSGGHDGEIALPIVRALLAGGANPNEKFPSGLTPLAAASFYSETGAAKMLLRHGAQINARDRRGRTALMYAVLYYSALDKPNFIPSHRPMLRLLLARGASVNARDSNGMTALMFSLVSDQNQYFDEKDAGRFGTRFRLEAASFLLANGADANARDNQGRTPLMWAAMTESGSDDNNEDAEKRRLEAMRYLLDHGAQINARDDKGWTPLMHAVNSYYQQPETTLAPARLLLQRGADPNLRAKNGISALQLAREEPLMLGVLRKAGAR